MKIILKLFTFFFLTAALSSCLFREPIFTEGFIKADSSLAGVYFTDDETGDERGREFAVLAPIGSDSFSLHYPVGTKGGSYFEVKPLQFAGKDIWQIRLAATFEDGLPQKDTPTYTLVLVEKTSEGKLSIRPLKAEGDHTASAATTLQALSAAKPDWDKLFGEAKTFVRLKDR